MTVGVPIPRQVIEILDAPVHDAIFRRRAVRSYTDEQVSQHAIERLLEVATHAPSPMNSQPWAFAIIQQPGVLADYAKRAVLLIKSEPPGFDTSGITSDVIAALREEVSHQGFDLFHGATTLIIMYSRYPAGVADCYLAAENLMLAAYAMGLGTCPVGLATPLFNLPEVKAELHVPEEWACAMPIVVGHPADYTEATPRNPPLVTVWW